MIKPIIYSDENFRVLIHNGYEEYDTNENHRQIEIDGLGSDPNATYIWKLKDLRITSSEEGLVHLVIKLDKIKREE